MNRHGISLAEGTFLALLAATTMLTPAAVCAQSVAPGEPSARAPIAIAQNSAEAKANIDKLVPVPDTTNVPRPTAAGIGRDGRAADAEPRSGLRRGDPAGSRGSRRDAGAARTASRSAAGLHRQGPGQGAARDFALRGRCGDRRETARS